MMKKSTSIWFGIPGFLLFMAMLACQLSGIPAMTDPEDPVTVTEMVQIPKTQEADETLGSTIPATPTTEPIPETLYETMLNPVDGAVMVHVPTGDFLMGSHQAPGYTKAFELEQLVYLEEFWIYQTPVTNAQFGEFIAATGFVTHAEEWGWSWAVENENYNHASWHSPEGPGSSISGREDHPVVHVNQDDAAAYCEWAGGRLPSEAEWEKAARGPDGNSYPWGDEPPTCEKANLHTCVGGTTPVGRYPQGISPYGVLDMAGNVLEWTQDLFDPPPIVYVVQRGGSFEDQQPLSYLRYRGNAFITAYHYGFRCRYPGNDVSIEPVEETTLPAWDGSTWVQMTDNEGWSRRNSHTSVVLHDGSMVVMGGHVEFYENDVWRSTDQGATWTQMTDNAGWTGRVDHTSVVMLDGSILLMGGYIGARGGDGIASLTDVWRSTDQGATWTLVTGYADWGPRSGHASVVLPDGSIVLMGGIFNRYKNDVWRSTDQGATWTKMTAAAPWTARVGHTSLALTDGSIILMGGTDGYQSYKSDVWRSTDMGATWTQITADAGWSPRSHHSSVGLADGSILLMGGSSLDDSGKNDVWFSSDQGATWTLITEDAGWSPRSRHTSVVLWDGSIVVIGVDVWRLDPLAIPAESTGNPILLTPLEIEITLGANPVDGADLVYVPVGEFLMGDEREPIQIYGPQRVVYLDSFWIYQTPVTNAQFAAFVAETGYETQAEFSGYSFLQNDIDHAYWAMPDGPGSDIIGMDSHPVVHISWYDAAAYCEWASGRLPTEAEWEKAARGSDGRLYPWGNQAPTCSLGNFKDCVGGTSPVDTYVDGASPYGVLDMLGNVQEWVMDWERFHFFNESPYLNPKGPEVGEHKLQRSGSFVTSSAFVFERHAHQPTISAYRIGFRCVIDHEP